MRCCYTNQISKKLLTMRYRLFFLAPALLFISCKKDNAPDPPPAETVYLCGGAQNATGVYYACYWKNGAKIDLTNANAPLGTDAYANDLAMLGNDLYIVGQEKLAGGRSQAKYWK